MLSISEFRNLQKKDLQDQSIHTCGGAISGTALIEVATTNKLKKCFAKLGSLCVLNYIIAQIVYELKIWQTELEKLNNNKT